MIKYFQILNKDELQELKGKSAKCGVLNFSFPDEYIKKMADLLNANNGYQIFAKDDNGKAVGYIAGAETIHPDYFTIHELFVDPELQGKGIGTELIQKIFEYSKKKKLKGVITQTEFENIPAQKLYEKIGFIKIDNPEWGRGITYKLKFTYSHRRPTKLKKAVYLVAATFLGVLLSFIAHAIIEISYFHWAGQYGVAITWYNGCALTPNLQIALWVVGIVGGFLLGQFWWKKVYVERVWAKK